MRQIRRGQRSRCNPPSLESLESRRLLSVIYSADMSTNPGWTLDTGWQYGVPAGTGGDPSAGHTGTNVLGTVIGSPGTYRPNMPGTYYAKSAAINCSHYTGVVLDFWRWLGIERSDNAEIQVSNDGSTWQTIWFNRGTVNETSWSHQTYDISSTADHERTVYVRWGAGPTDATINMCGWNIDDVTVSGTLDTTPPTVTAFTPADRSAVFTSSFNVDVTFSEPVQGVDATDLVLGGRAAAGAVVGTPSYQGSNKWRFPVSGATGGGMSLALAPDPGDITDMAGNALPASSWGYRVGLNTNIAYSSFSTSSTATFDIYVMSPDGTGAINLTNTTLINEESPSYSHDGARIVYTRGGVYGDQEIWVMGTDAASPHAIKTASSPNRYFAPMFSPDDTRIVYWTDTAATGTESIHIMNADGTGDIALTGAGNLDPQFSPDGTKIAFTSRRDGWPEVYVMNVDGTNQVRLTNSSLGEACQPSFSPDGSKIAYCSWWGVSYDIYVMNADGTGKVRLTDNNLMDLHPRFSLDGTQIVYESNFYSPNVTVMSSDGSSQHVVSSLAQASYSPNWGHDGTPPSVQEFDASGAYVLPGFTATYDVVFSENVWGVDASDFSLLCSGTATGTITSVTGSGTTYTLTATVSGEGLISAVLNDNDTIEDASGNKLGGYGTGNFAKISNTHALDHTAPVVSSLVLTDSNPSSATTVRFVVTFSESISGIGVGDFALSTTGTATGTISRVLDSTSDTAFYVEVSSVSGDGTLGVNLVDKDTIVDGASNPLGGIGAGNGNFTGPTYTLDHTAPRVLSIATLGPWQTNATQVSWAITFSEPVTGVSSASFQLAWTGTWSASSPVITGSGTTYTATLYTVSGDGSLGLNLKDYDWIADAAGNPLGGFGSVNGDFTGQTFLIDHTAPTAFAAVNNGADQRSMVTGLHVQFSESVPLTPPSLLLFTRAGTFVPNVALTIHDIVGTQQRYDITFTGTGLDNGSLPDGAYRLVIVGTSSRDLAGNPMAADYHLRFHRLFGDSNGDRKVDRTDLVAFRQALNVPANYVSYFDYDNDGAITLADYRQLKKRVLNRVVL